MGDRGYTPFQGGTNIFSFADSLDLIRGKHDIHLGIDLRANQMNVGTEAFQDGFWIPLGFFSGNPIADITLGLPTSLNTTRLSTARSPGAAGKSSAHTFRTIGASLRI